MSCQKPDRSGQPSASTVVCGGFTFTGASISAYSTFIYSKELNLIFDIGDVTEEMLSIDTVLVSHSHQDHLLGLTRYVGLRRLQHMSPPTVVVPAETAPGVERLFEAWQELEGFGGRRPPGLNLVALKPDQEIAVGARRFARTFEVDHAGPALGYTVFQRTQRLLPEFVGLEGRQIAALKARGTAVTKPRDANLVRYVGDTSPSTFERLRGMPPCPVTIIECTFLLPEHLCLAQARGHLHIQHIRDNFDVFGDGEVVLAHFSRRYRRRDIERLVNSQLTEDQLRGVHLFT